METLQYKIIKTKEQYNQYCNKLEELVYSNSNNKTVQDKIELLTLLIEKWDSENNGFTELNPIELLRSLMLEKNMKPKDLVTLLNVNKGYISEILHYKKGLSKEAIRILANYFKVSQEAFNREYKLKVAENSHFENASVMNTKKELAAV
jgi:HTH-type transcriptional regulator/antitoxin HigA